MLMYGGKSVDHVNDPQQADDCGAAKGQISEEAVHREGFTLLSCGTWFSMSYLSTPEFLVTTS